MRAWIFSDLHLEFDDDIHPAEFQTLMSAFALGIFLTGDP